MRFRYCGHTLLIDARKSVGSTAEIHRELSDEEIARVSRAYHSWRGEKGARVYEDVPGFCKIASAEEIEAHGFVLTPGRYVGAEDVEEDSDLFKKR